MTTVRFVISTGITVLNIATRVFGIRYFAVFGADLNQQVERKLSVYYGENEGPIPCVSFHQTYSVSIRFHFLVRRKSGLHQNDRGNHHRVLPDNDGQRVSV